jgi:hypothetical protein
MRIIGEQFVLLLKQIEKSVSRQRIVLGDEIPNLHQVLSASGVIRMRDISPAPSAFRYLRPA